MTLSESLQTSSLRTFRPPKDMLSTRGARWAKSTFAHGAHAYFDPVTNPDAPVSSLNAENWLVHQDLASFFDANVSFDAACCAYGEGYTGTLRLRNAMALHLNAHFGPAHPIHAEETTFTAGVTDLNEVCALVTCNPDQRDAIMLGRPVYGAFVQDLTTRTGIQLEHVHVGDTDQFSPDCVGRFEAGFEDAQRRGVNVRALIICNPHNPLGQCYPRETLIGLLRLCASKGIHLISDEIYALSVYERPGRESEHFTSVRAIDLGGIIDPIQVHVLYGLSKDFGAAGLRLGCLISQSDEFTRAARAICRFSSPSQYSMVLAATLLENQDFVRSFLSISHERLLRSRLLAEGILDRIGIDYHRKGNSGLFIWLDLSPYLPLEQANGDGWAAHRLLLERIENFGVLMSGGETYRAPRPGRYRLVHCLPEASLREALKRISLAIGKS